MQLHAGAKIAERYLVVRRVGAGGIGEVWAGERTSDGATVAIKTLLPAQGSERHELVQRFKREAYFLQRIQSDYVGRVLDFVADETYGFALVMEFIEGPLLASVLAKRTLSVEETLDLGIDIASALVDLHASRIVHRDLKPGNIIMRPLPGGGVRATVLDFGLSRLMSSCTEDSSDELTGLTKANAALGTIEYMAPEQLLNSRDVTPAADLYALGAILYRACKGEHAFPDRDPAKLAQAKLRGDAPALDVGRSDEIASGLARIVDKTLRKQPKERFSEAALVLAELDELRDRARRRGSAPRASAGSGAIAARRGDDDDHSTMSRNPKEAEASIIRSNAKTVPLPPKVSAHKPAAPAPSSRPEEGKDQRGAASAVRPAAAEPAPTTNGVPAVLAVVGVLVSVAAGIVIGRVTSPPRVTPTAPMQSVGTTAASAPASPPIATSTSSSSPGASTTTGPARSESEVGTVEAQVATSASAAARTTNLADSTAKPADGAPSANPVTREK